MTKTSGSILLTESLKAMGVDTIFFLRGGPMGAVAEYCVDLGIRLIDVRDERAASMMALAYARVTGKPGICMTGAGPDTTNITTGISNAAMDCVPVIAICGSASLRTHAMHAFQETDQLGIMKSIAKRAWRVPMAEKIPGFVSMAFRHATTGCTGPVYLEFPANLLNKIEEMDVDTVATPPQKHRPLGDPALVKEAIKILARAEKPIVLSGNGILWSEASAELKDFVDATQIPFYTTPLSRGVIPEDHPLCFPGARSAAWGEADAVIVIGTRASFIISHLLPPRFNASAKIIEVNIDAEEIGHNRPVDVGIQGDAKAVLQQLTKEAKGKFTPRTAWIDKLRKIDTDRQAKVAPLLNSTDKPIHPLRLCKEVRDFLPRNAILVVDGQVILNYARQTIPSYLPGHRLNPGVSGCMGVGVPFSIGAKVARPEAPVMLLSGDGSFGFHAMEIDTAVRHKVPVVIVVSNNGGWNTKRNFIRPERDRPGRNLGFTRYDKVAEALGAYGQFVEDPADIRPALERAFQCGKPALVNVITDPMVAPTTQEFAQDDKPWEV
ncbi:MAG: thiamine pyrophosphate-binding protein [Dehalococcoidales bacterium]|nr:thiamine pyrophosphate-binding protein [Dehalococcoidales bacterium]